MPSVIDQAWVEVVPKLDRFGPNLRRGIDNALKDTTATLDRGGRDAGRKLGDSIARGVTQQMRGANGQFIAAGAAGGKAVGDEFGSEFTRGVDGRLRDARGRFVTEGDTLGRKLGESTGKGFSLGLGDHIRDAVKLAVGASVVAGIAAVTGAIARIGMAYEDNVNIFRVVTKATTAEMAAMEAKARELGAAIDLPGVSAAGAASAMTELAKNGLDVQQSMDAARATLQLARVALMSEAEAAEIAGNAVNAFGLEAADVRMVTDEFAAAANSSSLEVKDVADSFKMGAAVFAGFQGSVVGPKEAITELTTAIAILGQAGIKGSDAGTSLKQTLLMLTGPSEKAKNAMQAVFYAAQGAAIGEEQLSQAIDGTKKNRLKALSAIRDSNKGLKLEGDIAYTASGRMRPLRDIIDLTSRGLKGMSDEQRNAAVTTIFGADAARAILALMRGGLPAYDAMRKALLQQGAAADFAAARNQGLRGAIDNVRSQFENAAISIFNVAKGPLTSGLAGFATALPGIFAEIGNQVRDVLPNLREIGDFFGELAQAAAPGALFVLAAAFTAVKLALDVLGPILGTAADLIEAGGPAVQILVGALLAWEAATLAVKAAQALAIGTQTAWLALVNRSAAAVGLAAAATWFMNTTLGVFIGVKALEVAAWVSATIATAAATVATWAAAAATWALNAAIAVLTSPITLVVLAIAAFVGALVYAYKNSETFRSIVDAAFRGVAAAASWMWNTVLKPVLTAIWWTLKNVVWPIFVTAFAAIKLAVGLAFTGIKWYWEHVVLPVFRAVAAVAQWLWRHIFVPVFNGIKWAVSQAFTGIKWVWDNILKPTFGFLERTVGKVAGWFGKAADGAGRQWGRVKELAKTPIRFVIETVLNNGLIKAFNWVADKIPGGKRITPVPLPFAAGGVYPGYTPGRDVGIAAVSGGEAIMRPEWTRAVGPDRVHAMNAAARSGGAGAVARMLGGHGYALGGIIPTPGDAWRAAKAVGGRIKSFGGAALREAFTHATDPVFNLLNRIRGNALGDLAAAGPLALRSKVLGWLGQQDAAGAAGGGATPWTGGGSPFRQVGWGGHLFNARTAQMLMAAQRMLGQAFRVTQGSYSRRVAASGSTHAGGGAVDIGAPTSLAAQSALRRAGFAAWIRTPGQGPWARHIHAIAIGDPTASPAARRQVSSFLRGGNGLGGMARGGIATFDQGGWLPPGLSLAYNGTGRPERVSPAGAAPVVHVHLENRGVIGSRREAYDWLAEAFDRLQREGRVQVSTG